MKTKAAYRVGYKKPPKHSRFKPGHSGNPKGRPKGTKNLATDLREELEERIVVTEGQKAIEITKQRAMVKTMLAKALKGDTRAAQVLVNLKLGLDQADSHGHEEDILDEEDQAILSRFAKKLAGDPDNEGEE